jgi:hypothetical protein
MHPITPCWAPNPLLQNVAGYLDAILSSEGTRFSFCLNATQQRGTKRQVDFDFVLSLPEATHASLLSILSHTDFECHSNLRRFAGWSPSTPNAVPISNASPLLVSAPPSRPVSKDFIRHLPL